MYREGREGQGIIYQLLHRKRLNVKVKKKCTKNVTSHLYIKVI